MLLIERIKKEKWFLISLFLFSLVIRSLVFSFFLGEEKNYWQVDSKTYNQIAENISKGKGLSISDSPQFYRLPGYPIFLSIYYKFFGVDTKNVLWFQIFIASLIPLLIFLLSLVLFRNNVYIAKASSLYSSIHLGLVLYSGFFMTESLFIFFFLLFSILFFSSFHMFFCYKELLDKKSFGLKNIICQKSICSGPAFVELQEKLELQDEAIAKRSIFLQIFFAGIFLGIAGMIRPVGHYLIFLSLLMLLFSYGSFLYKLKKGFFLSLGWLIPVFPWLLRNYILLGQLFFHTLPGGHFLHLSAARVAMHSQKCSYWQARENLEKEVSVLTQKKSNELNRDLNPIEHCNIREKLAVKYFLKYPTITLKNWATDILRTSLSLYSAELVFLDSKRQGIDFFDKNRTIWSMFKRYLFPKTENNLLKFIILLEILAFLFVLIGIFFAFIKLVIRLKSGSLSGMCAWVKVLPFIVLFLVIGLSGGFNRMRLPVEPFLMILSFSFWVSLFYKKD